MPGGRKPKYTRRTFRESVDRYFRSISYTEAFTDKRGNVIHNDDGEEICVLRYATPPCVSALCWFLGIDKSTWQNYANDELHPELADICKEVRVRFEAYLEQELLTRRKGVQGIIFNLQNNYGWKQKQEIELGADTRKQMAGYNVSLDEKLALIADARSALAEEDGEKA